jgi:16S rRNA (uracil1498-N3)-methyltransferase
MARRRFFVDEIRGGRAQIQGDDAHHLTRVLRVEAGQKYEISDNRNVYLAEVEIARKSLVSFSVLEKLSSPETLVRIALIPALIKFDRFEWMVEKATELGVESVLPFEAERTEKGLGRAAEKRLERWRRIAREASEQSRRSRLPEIAAPVAFEDAIRTQADLKLALEEQAGALPVLSAVLERSQASASVAVLVGPEGGWTERERSAIREAGWAPASLGSTILRAETAAIAALAVVGAAYAGSSNTEAGGI